ncbi:hypothetical protein H6F79_14770 [Trichocoleus sp. FACHB-69]|uniref:hypothetical protein n=1 Tax=Trichocoleus sp. FACHB-69 TaxID=2692874 RepID=UPI0016894AF7|nr:hypothetical protein [Trichocoleus sp. FACHB-69]MBD1933070.1 hypothetical protein [Trichocoleus sp. FACHB-69]
MQAWISSSMPLTGKIGVPKSWASSSTVISSRSPKSFPFNFSGFFGRYWYQFIFCWTKAR